jgi:hypothetical protein
MMVFNMVCCYTSFFLVLLQMILFLYRNQTMITSKQLQSKVNQGLAPREHMIFHRI